MFTLPRQPLTVLLCLGLFAPVPVFAAPLGWAASVSEAAAHNADLRAAQLNLEAAHYRERAAASGFLPQVSAGTGYTDSSGNALTTTSVPQYNASVTATQNVFAGFLDAAKVEQARGNREAAEANLATARARLSQELKQAYAGLRYAQDNVILTERIVRRLEENLRLVELRYEGGRENKGSFLLTQATLAQARYENLQARQALVTARTQLARALGRSEMDGLTVDGAVPVSLPEPAPDFRALAQQTPDVRLVSAQEKTAAAGVRLARAGLYPSVNLTGTVARDGGDWFPDEDRRTVGVSLSVPIFNGGRDYYGSKAAVASLAAAGSNREQAERLARSRLTQAYAAYVESVEKLRVDEAFLEAATTRATIARSRYNIGVMSFEDWDRIENDLILRQKVALLSQRERVAAEAAWEQVQGKGVIP